MMFCVYLVCCVMLIYNRHTGKPGPYKKPENRDPGPGTLEEPKNGNLIQSTDEEQTLVNDESNETLEWSPIAPKLVDKK